MTIPFTKAHGARNDFLLTRRDDLHQNRIPEHAGFAAIARAICDRHTGVGADGWIVVGVEPGVDARIDLWNSDGSTSAISGNGTRCAAAFVVTNREATSLFEPVPAAARVSIATGAGVRHLDLLQRTSRRFVFEMNMGRARVDELHATVLGRDAAILDVGNPQCAIFVNDFDRDWQSAGAAIERHPRFPNRTNVSFVEVLDRHTLSVLFFERGAGVTMSSGTGSTAAAAAAVARGLVDPPVEVRTPAGPLQLRWQGEDIFLAGPAEIIAAGEFYLENIATTDVTGG